ncbi:MAG: TrkA C-terminal domain-containing protein [Lachnospiraceae bacterium]|nr:TrkA C-terminal domain-containing protein [Lachnospiraceae bacterium]
MDFGLSLVLILVILVIYIVMINIFSIMLRITGVPASIAGFQGISLFTNCGYTTNESETITSTKLRRKIALACMITGNFFSVIIVSLIVNMISHFSVENAKQTYQIAYIAIGIFVGAMIVFQLPPVKRTFSKTIQIIVERRIEKKSKDNVITIIENFMGEAVIEVYVHWIPEILYGKTIHESKIKAEYNINILSIKRNKRMIDITRNTQMEKNDVLLVFGTYAAVREVFSIEAAHERKLASEEASKSLTKSFNELDLIDNFNENAMVEVHCRIVPFFLENKTLFESNLKDKFGINIIFIKRGNDIIEVNKDTIIRTGDMLMVFGPFQAIKNVFIY